MNIENLLNEINHICKKYDEIYKLSGENFNVFQILDLQSDELSHSKIIAELLNPKGSHNMEYIFLKLFLDKIIEISKEPQEFENDNIQEHRDKRIEKLENCIKNQELKNTMIKTEQTTKLGRADIVMTINQTKIVIENKIYASDQEEQLKRYRADFGEEATIVYLTLDGRKPSPYSTGKGEDKENMYDILISYTDIIPLLEQCKEKSVNFPYLRETIAQYINLLKFLTGQTRSKDMSDEIIAAVLKSENLKTAFYLLEHAEEIKRQIWSTRFAHAMKKIAGEYSSLELILPTAKTNGWWCISLKDKYLTEKDIEIRFDINSLNLDRFTYGFRRSDDKKGIDMRIWTETFKKVEGEKPGTSNKWWAWSRELKDDYSWTKEELADLFSEDSKIIREKIKELFAMLEKIKSLPNPLP